MVSQTSVQARKLIDLGELDAALDLMWESIDEGSQEARLDLAKLFDEVGLHAFSQDQYLALAGERGTISKEATVGLFGNLVWLRDYKAAEALALKHAHVREVFGDYATNSERDFSTLRFSTPEFSNLISQLLHDRVENSASIDTDETLTSHQNLMVIDENLFNIACDLSFTKRSILAEVSVDVPVGLGTSLPKRAIDAVGEPIDRARNYLISCSNLVAELATIEDLDGDDPLLVAAVRNGKAVANKLVLLQGDFTLTDSDSQLIGNICWGLLKSTNPMERFAGFVLGGITN